MVFRYRLKVDLDNFKEDHPIFGEGMLVFKPMEFRNPLNQGDDVGVYRHNLGEIVGIEHYNSDYKDFSDVEVDFSKGMGDSIAIEHIVLMFLESKGMKPLRTGTRAYTEKRYEEFRRTVDSVDHVEGFRDKDDWDEFRESLREYYEKL